jgi:hypothetical protein
MHPPERAAEIARYATTPARRVSLDYEAYEENTGKLRTEKS